MHGKATGPTIAQAMAIVVCISVLQILQVKKVLSSFSAPAGRPRQCHGARISRPDLPK